jgi:Uma2 family endonuclease
MKQYQRQYPIAAGRMRMSRRDTKNNTLQYIHNNNPMIARRLGSEILDGKHFPLSIPAVKHQAVTLKIAAALLRHAEILKIGRVLPGPCEVVLSDRMVIQPDILFIKNERRGLIGEWSLRGAPDLVIEVLSPDTRERDLKAKKRIYANFEIPEYWVVDPDACTVDTLVWSELGYISAGRYNRSNRVSSPLLPTFNLPLSGVFHYREEW